jgi:NAD+ synthase
MKIELDCEREYKSIIDWMTVYKDATNCKGVVLGISGGKDSTVVAMLSKKVFGDNVFGVIMPNGVQSDIDDAIQVCESLNLNYSIVNIGKAYDSLLGSIEYKTVKNYETLDRTIVDNGPKISNKAKTNIPPRLRMTTLYAIAQTLGYRVIGTGNKSERAIGWFTKYGDGGYDLNPIAHLTCTEVVQLGQYLCKQFDLDESLITKSPADGLTGKSDEDNFGFTYEQLDTWLLNDGDCGDEAINNKIMKLYKQSEHKRKEQILYTHSWFLD